MENRETKNPELYICMKMPNSMGFYSTVRIHSKNTKYFVCFFFLSQALYPGASLSICHFRFRTESCLALHLPALASDATQKLPLNYSWKYLNGIYRCRFAASIIAPAPNAYETSQIESVEYAKNQRYQSIDAFGSIFGFRTDKWPAESYVDS